MEDCPEKGIIKCVFIYTMQYIFSNFVFIFYLFIYLFIYIFCNFLSSHKSDIKQIEIAKKKTTLQA